MENYNNQSQCAYPIFCQTQKAFSIVDSFGISQGSIFGVKPDFVYDSYDYLTQCSLQNVHYVFSWI